jgi:ABC-type antimicrobial peptide transport system permease subunit
LDLVIRSSDYANAASLVKDVRNAIRAVDPDQPVSNITTMDAHLAGLVVTKRFSAVLMGALATLGLTLAIIGLYGVMAYSVSRQTGEMGLRMALRVTRENIFQIVVGRGVRLVIPGLCMGLIGALNLTRFLSGTLYRVNASDPMTFGSVAALLGLTALAACLVPAWRATRVDPLVALRYE